MSFNKKNLEDTFNCLSSPCLITGDFNGWHSSWGSTKNNKRGNILNKYITQSNFILLNGGSPTHYSTSHIDLSFASPVIKINSTWKVHDDLSGCDHFPIIMTLFPNSTTEHIRKRINFILDKANWTKFQALSTEYEKTRPISLKINKEAANIQKKYNAKRKSIYSSSYT